MIGSKKKTVFALLISVTLLLASCGSGEKKDAGGGTPSVAAGQSLDISAADVSGTPKFYSFTVDGTKMGVIAVKAPDGSIRTALNTCQVCNGSPEAYFKQAGKVLQCQNCGSQFPTERVGIEAGGCNPVPILEAERSTSDEVISISYDTLARYAPLFAVWKG